MKKPLETANEKATARFAKYEALLRKKRRELDPRSSGNEIHDLTASIGMTSDKSDGYSVNESAVVWGQLSTNSNEALRQIDAALERLAEGTFGMCVDCDKKIPLDRLDALPFTPCCVDCQRMEEGLRQRGVTRSDIQDILV